MLNMACNVVIVGGYKSYTNVYYYSTYYIWYMIPNIFRWGWIFLSYQQTYNFYFILSWNEKCDKPTDAVVGRQPMNWNLRILRIVFYSDETYFIPRTTQTQIYTFGQIQNLILQRLY